MQDFRRLRERAHQARRLSRLLTVDEERARLEAYAEALESQIEPSDETPEPEAS